jgi:uncharacterized protein (DUF952 family)
MTHVYKLLGAQEWDVAQAAGAFTGSPIDIADGYIHLSTATQAQETARLYFHGRKDLMILQIEAEPLGEALKWEPSRGGSLFPHLYGTLAPGQVAEARAVPLDLAGAPQLGDLQP